MKPDLLETLNCPFCCGDLEYRPSAGQLVCQSCSRTYPCVEPAGAQESQLRIPLFTPPADITPSEKIARGPELGTPWRQANWRFAQVQINHLTPDALILDVGAGRGDFADLYRNRRTLALEVYPYPEIDIVCDLTQVNPFRPTSFGAILLLNVLEHVYDTHKLLGTLADLLKPSGCLIMAIPFMVKMHQVPVDFVRYTHFALQRLGEAHGLQIDLIEGYYDPLFFLSEGIGNLKNAVLPELSGAPRRLANLKLHGIQLLANGLQRSLKAVGYTPGKTTSPDSVRSLAPTGYHVVYRKIWK
jgi:SAM-dependent methyltransferase